MHNRASRCSCVALKSSGTDCCVDGNSWSIHRNYSAKLAKKHRIHSCFAYSGSLLAARAMSLGEMIIWKAPCDFQSAKHNKDNDTCLSGLSSRQPRVQYMGKSSPPAQLKATQVAGAVIRRYCTYPDHHLRTFHDQQDIQPVLEV